MSSEPARTPETAVTGASAAPPPAAAPALDPLLAAWLRTGPSACPRCRYDVSAAARPACPECGMPLRLHVGLADPVTLPWTIVLTLLALAPGLAGLMVFGTILHELINDGRILLRRPAGPLLAILPVVVVPPILWIAGRRRLVRLAPGPRRVSLGLFTAIAFVTIVLAVSRLS